MAVANPLDPNVVDNLRFATQKDIVIYVAPAAQIQTMIERYYGSEISDMEDVLASLAGDASLKAVQRHWNSIGARDTRRSKTTKKGLSRGPLIASTTAMTLPSMIQGMMVRALSAPFQAG